MAFLKLGWKNTVIIIEGATFRKRIIILVITRTLTGQGPLMVFASGYVQRPPWLVPAAGVHATFAATVAQVHRLVVVEIKAHKREQQSTFASE